MKNLVAASALLLLAACSATEASPAEIVTDTITAKVMETTTVETTATLPPVTMVETASTTVPVTSTAIETETKMKTVTVTATVEPEQAMAPNGEYLIGTDIKPGTWQCKNPSDQMYWVVKTRSGDIVENDLGSIALVSASGYMLSLSGCMDDWRRVD